MDKLQQVSQSLENKIDLTEKQIELAFELEQLNEIYAPFKLSDDDIIRWVKRINDVKPELTPIELNEIVLNFITGKFVFNKNLGIANIFKPKIRKDEYNLMCPHGKWNGFLTEDELIKKTENGYWTLIKSENV